MGAQLPVTNHSIHDLGKSKQKGRTMQAFLEGTLESSGSFKNEVPRSHPQIFLLAGLLLTSEDKYF